MGIYIIEHQPVPDNYSEHARIMHVQIVRIRIEVTNQAVYWQHMWRVHSSGVWDDNEHWMAPGSRVIVMPMFGIRFRAAVPLAQLPAGTQRAFVFADALTP